MTAQDEPDSALAEALAAAATGHRPAEVTRFRTGAQHFVFEVGFDDRAPLVVRLARARDRAAMVGASRLSKKLRPLGIPLPEIIAESLDPPFPWLILERLPGPDLGAVIAGLPASRLGAIAAQIARAQQITMGTATAGRYGYAVDPQDAPHTHWSAVLEANLQRSRTRIAAAALFDPGPLDAVARLIAGVRAELDAEPPHPFLHDTTTKNVIVTPEGEFSGIIDVDDLCFGDPRYVPALTLASLLASGRPTTYVDAWMKLADFRDDRIFRLYVALFLVDFMSEHGQAFNGNQPASSAEERRQLLGVFSESLHRTAS
jgi:Ser/Thr protein kinase RdoA (MazF antagonist)